MSSESREVAANLIEALDRRHDDLRLSRALLEEQLREAPSDRGRVMVEVADITVRINAAAALAEGARMMAATLKVWP